MRHLSATMSAKNTLWMCVALAAAILAAFLVVVLGTPTKRAEAAFPGQNGKIAFVSGYGNPEIFTMKANGDNKTQLTNNRHAQDHDPAFSPNGSKIVFWSFSCVTACNWDIYTMSANGTNKKNLNLTRSTQPAFDPAWSPDGTRIAFARSNCIGCHSDIYVINKDGSGLTRITTSPKEDSQPAWSPDGTRIAFERGTPNGDTKIYVMKAARESATNRPQHLTTSGSGVVEHNPAWSPNGTRIAFNSDQSGHFALYSIRADGSDQIRLTTTTRGTDPAWSPDGTKIAFSGKRGSDSTVGVFVMKAAPESATNRPKRLTSNQILSGSPDWQPLS